MEDTNTAAPTRLRALADQVDCLTEDDFLILAGITPGTADAWRKRHKGPEWIRIGNRVLYPINGVLLHLDSLRRQPRVMAKELL